MASLDSIEKETGLLLGEGEFGFVREVFWRFGQAWVPRHGACRRRLISVVPDFAALAIPRSLFLASVVDCPNLPVVLVLREIRNADSPRPEPGPVNRTRKSFQLATGASTEHSRLAFIDVPHRVNEITLRGICSPSEVARRNPSLLEVFVNPRDEEHVAQTGLYSTRSRKELICEAVTDAAETQFVPTLFLLEESQDAKAALPSLGIVIYPCQG